MKHRSSVLRNQHASSRKFCAFCRYSVILKCLNLDASSLFPETNEFFNSCSGDYTQSLPESLPGLQATKNTRCDAIFRNSTAENSRARWLEISHFVEFDTCTRVSVRKPSIHRFAFGRKHSCGWIFPEIALPGMFGLSAMAVQTRPWKASAPLLHARRKSPRTA